MTTHRVEHTKNYVVLQNSVLTDSRLSWKARGLLGYLLTKPNDWRVIVAHLVTQSEEDGRASVTTAIAELEKFGYLKRTGLRTDRGKFNGYDYDLFEVPDQSVFDNQQRNRVRLSGNGKSDTTKYLKEPNTERISTEADSQVVDMALVRERNKSIKAALRSNLPSVTLKVPRK